MGYSVQQQNGDKEKGNFGVGMYSYEHDATRHEWFETKEAAIARAEELAAQRLGHKVELLQRIGFVTADIPTKLVEI